MCEQQQQQQNENCVCSCVSRLGLVLQHMGMFPVMSFFAHLMERIAMLPDAIYFDWLFSPSVLDVHVIFLEECNYSLLRSSFIASRSYASQWLSVTSWERILYRAELL